MTMNDRENFLRRILDKKLQQHAALQREYIKAKANPHCYSFRDATDVKDDLKWSEWFITSIQKALEPKETA